MIAIVDYGVGNLFSLRSSLQAIGGETVVTADPAELAAADRIILPGVGAFGDAAEKLRHSGLDLVLKEQAAAGKPLMGICLGMQLLLTESLEYGHHQGLDLIPGSIRPIGETVPAGTKIPHIGWNSLQLGENKHRLFSRIEEGDYVYFVHSYHGVCDDRYVIARADYGAPLTAAVANGSVLGCQFHPEKSGAVGLRILRAFCEEDF